MRHFHMILQIDFKFVFHLFDVGASDLGSAPKHQIAFNIPAYITSFSFSCYCASLVWWKYLYCNLGNPSMRRIGITVRSARSSLLPNELPSEPWLEGIIWAHIRVGIFWYMDIRDFKTLDVSGYLAEMGGGEGHPCIRAVQATRV